MIQAKFIGITWVRGTKKHRWECPNCRENKRAECRFNLSVHKENIIHKCRFCDIDLLIKK